jgi:ATP-dependent RNA helicase DeaD
MTPKLFSELGLSAEVLKAIDRLGFEQASPIQAEAIPLLREGLDIVGQSQTGSGKTAAFGIPAVERVDTAKSGVQVLILCPTRELAVQVSEEMHKLAFFKQGLRVLPIYGGQSYERQFHGLRLGAHIVIGTPGRVLDHMRRGTLRLDTVGLVVLDEADVMLNMGFREDIEAVLQATPSGRQTVFFSATMPRAIRELIERHARSPRSVRIEQKALTVPTVEQVYYEVDRRFKVELLTRLIDLHDLKLGIVFCNTKRMVDDLADHLEAAGYLADRLHGDMTQNMRDRVMNKFRKSGLEFLVATDVAARGIDVDDLQVVFNYDLPYDVEDYVHRIGRTGRAGRSGRAISFVSGRELFQVRNIERYTNMRLHRGRIPTEAEVEEARENVFVDRLRKLLQSGDFRQQEALVERLLEEGFTSADIASASLALLQGAEQAAAPAPKAPERAAGWERPERPERPERRERPPQRERQDRPPRPERGRGTEPRPAPPAPVEPVEPEQSVEPVAVAPAAVSPEPAPEMAAAAPAAEPITSEPVAPTEPVAAPMPSPVPMAEERPVRRPERPERPERPVRPDRPARKPFERRPRPEMGEGRRPFRAAGGPPWARPERMERPDRRERPERPDRRERPDRPAWGAGPAAEGRPVRERGPARPVAAPRPRRSPPGQFTRLHVNVGAEMGVGPGDVVGAIAGETGLPAQVVGTIDIRERHLFVDVASEHARAISSKLNRAQLRGHRMKVKTA